MKKQKLIILSLCLVCAMSASAQYHEDALRFSRTNWLMGSSARMQGLSGAQTSLGGDVSMIGSNPAGLGFYNRSSAAISMGLDFHNSDDAFAGLITPNFNSVFGVRNAAVVMNYNTGRYSDAKFKGGSLGISFSKINDFNREFTYEGESGTSLLDKALEDLNNGRANQITRAFFNQFLVDEFLFFASDPINTNYFPESEGVITPNQNGDFVEWGSPISTIPFQRENYIQRGSQHQIDISWGGNYDDKLYFGAGLGIQTIYFNRERRYEEFEFIDQDGFLDPYLNSFELSDNLVTRGAGVNANFGLIFRPVNVVTLGITYQTPTYLSLREESDLVLFSNWENFEYEDADGTKYNLQEIDGYQSPIIEANYKIRTPARLNLGSTFFLGKLGFITADIEMVDYANAELQSQDFSALSDNQLILGFKSVMNYRIGAELRMENIRFRGGIAGDQDPLGLGNDLQHLTFGIGYKSRDYFVDLALVNTSMQQQYAPYSFNVFDLPDPIVQSDVSNTTITFTAGFSF